MVESRAPRSLDFLDARLKPVCDAYLQAAQVPGASFAIIAARIGKVEWAFLSSTSYRLVNDSCLFPNSKMNVRSDFS